VASIFSSLFYLAESLSEYWYAGMTGGLAKIYRKPLNTIGKVILDHILLYTGTV
jgi:hypothetical protein